MTDTQSVRFDGRQSGYVPPAELTIDPSLKMHRGKRQRVDPITFEVVRHSLWNVNEEHGATIQRLSGSSM